MDIVRNQVRSELINALESSPVVLLLGPRQAGKTSLARSLAHDPQNYFDLENMVDQRRLEENPQGELSRLYGLVIIDEAQRQPSLFPVLRYLADRPGNPAKFLLLGSASPHLMRGASESLAGRASYVDMAGFNVSEVEPQHHETLWLQGGLPPAFLRDEPTSFKWRLDYLRAMIEQDLRELATTRMQPAALRKFLLLLAQSHGQVWKHSTAAEVLSVDYKTIQRHLELFEGMFLIRLLHPFERNLNKRLRKAPKLFFRDTGLMHAMLAIRNQRELRGHPLVGGSWEGFGIEQVIRSLGLRESECSSYGVHGGDEMDLVVERAGKTYGFEFKASDSPGTTASMHNSMRDLKLAKVFVVHPGDRTFNLAANIEAIAVRDLPARRDKWEIP